ncbi:MAG: hypothetical protein K2J80_12060 [Oscillospiraceae bacterium]|nr:hypothetical protein [Oscillospiraceae bacterium]
MFGTIFKSLKVSIGETNNEWLFNKICFSSNRSGISRRIKGTLRYSESFENSNFDNIYTLTFKRDKKSVVAEVRKLLATFYNNLEDEIFLREESERFLAREFEDFYYYAFKYVVDRGQVRFEDSENYDPEKLTNAFRQIGYQPVNYDEYIALIMNVLNSRRNITKSVSQYDAVLLTIVDESVLWDDIDNNGLRHWLIPKKEQINSAESKLLEIIFAEDNRQNPADSYNAALEQVHALKWYNYTLRMFQLVSGFNKSELVYMEIYNLLNELVADERIKKFPTSTLLVDFLQKAPMNYNSAVERPEKANYYLHILAIAFFKLNAAVLLTNLGKPLPENFTLDPTEDLSKLEIIDVIMEQPLPPELEGLDEIEKRLYRFSKLYLEIANESPETQKIISFSCYGELFKLVNDERVQNDYLSKNRSWCKNVRALTEMVYRDVSYKIYREYSSVDNKKDNGLMRNFLTDVDIVNNYLKKVTSIDGTLTDEPSEMFSRKKQNGIGRFILRRATLDDIDDILKLYSPEESLEGKPYRRAVFVVSKKESFEDSIAAGDAFVVYEVEKNERGEYVPACLACYAGIVSSTYRRNEANEMPQKYYSTAMNEKFAELYASANQLEELTYLDFDTILVNDGRAGVSTQSYRGGGWQRLMLVLAEKLAITKKCQYICGTVGFANSVSRRNFNLNGYSPIAMEHYTLPESEKSRYYEYITSGFTISIHDNNGTSKTILKKATERERADYESNWQREYRYYEEDYKRYSRFRDFTIAREDYKQDRDVPRLFVLLNMDSSCQAPTIPDRHPR